MGAWVIGHMKSWGNDASSAAGSPDGGEAATGGGSDDGSGAAGGGGGGATAAGAGASGGGSAAAGAGAGAPSGSIVRRRHLWHNHVVTPSPSWSKIMPFFSSSSSSVPPGKMQAMCATGASSWPILAEHPSHETSGSSPVPGRRNCAQTTHGCVRRRLGGMAADWQPLAPAAFAAASAVKVPRLTGVSGLEIWIVEVLCHRSTCLSPRCVDAGCV